MSLAAQVRWRFRTLFGKNRIEVEMAEEMRLHLEHRIRQNLTAGMAPEKARFAALRKFGAVTQVQERCRDNRGWTWLERWLQDFNYGLRSLRQKPGFTITALLTLALGIGANAAVFSLVRSVLLEPLPYPHSEQLMMLWEKQPNVDVAPFSWIDFQYYRRHNRSFSDLAAYRMVRYGLTGDGDPEQYSAAQVTASMFAVMGLPPQIGRYFRQDEDQPNARGLVVLTDSLWRQRFGGDVSVLGRTLRLDGIDFTVIGVLPREFSAPGNAGFVTQLGRASGNGGWGLRTMRPNIFAVGRLRAAVTAQRALADLKQVADSLDHDYPDGSASTVSGQLFFDQTVGRYRNGLWLLLGAVALVLLIACANLANLLLARGAGREPEIAVRAALGAGRARIISQCLAESLLLAAGGGVLGVAAAALARRGIVSLSPAGVERFQQAGIDASVLAAAFGLSLLTALVFGLWPAWRAAQTDLRASLERGGRSGSAGPGAAGMRDALIVAEVAITLVLLVGAGLLLKSFAQEAAAQLGFRTHGVLTARVKPPWVIYQTREKSLELNRRLLEQTAALPGVQSAALAAWVPLAPLGRYSSYFIDGSTGPTPGEAPQAELDLVSDRYFETLGIPLLHGRIFGPEEGPHSPLAVIVDRAFARKNWGEEEAVGKSIRLGGEPLVTVVNSLELNGNKAKPQGGPFGGRFTIVGVVPELRLYGYAADPRLPQIYLSARQAPPNDFILLARGRGDAAALAAPLRRAVRQADPNQPISEVRSMDERLSDTFAASRLYTYLLTIFAALALLLASVGLYGVLAYHVSRRRAEFGIRLALGGLGTQITAMVLRRGLRLIAIGCVLGVIGSAALGRVLSSLLYRTSALDGEVIAGVAGVMVMVSLAASWLPSRRAARVPPSEALRAP